MKGFFFFLLRIKRIRKINVLIDRKRDKNASNSSNKDDIYNECEEYEGIIIFVRMYF